MSQPLQTERLMDYPDVQLPARWPRTSEEDFALEVIYFKRWLRTLRKAEETGRVPAKVPLETVLAGWSLRRQLYRITDLSLKAKVANVGEIAKRYGLTKLWTPRYYTTLKSHLEKYLGHYPNGTLLRRYFCGRCGRAIWAEKSVRAGLGSVCIHKRGL